MQIVHLYIEHPTLQLNTTFSYCYNSKVEIEKGTRVKVDFNGRMIVGFVDHCQFVDSLEEYEKQVGYSLKGISEIIDEKPILNDELYQLGLWMSKTTVSPAISCFQCMLPAALKPNSSKKTIVQENYVEVINENIMSQYALENKVMKLGDFKLITGDYRYNKFKKNGDIRVFKKEREAQVSDLSISEAPYPLTDQQMAAIKAINDTDKNIILLHGLTGSGKTEVYMQLAKQVINQGRQVLILVPEISLTPQMTKRFQQRFNNNIAIYHSGLSYQQKYEQYQLVKNEKVKIVVGTRSSVFMPFSNLGLIVIDEEHDNSYKQDSTPKYNARDIAIHRSELHNCKVVLGSATPTLESYARAVKGVYQLVSLTSRISNSLPQSHLVDMSKEIRKGNYIVSAPLKAAIADRLEKHQQVILLLNRRGYTPIMKCINCGEVLMCPHCDIAMAYHKDSNSLVCHSCGHSQSADVTCPKCGKKNWRNYGIGTQRLSEELQNCFPNARIVRMDADSTKNKDSHSTILNDFGEGKYDILLGTQMISKGLDYPNVTLVGIFNADAPLSRSDYRSVEMTFDLIVQASGRSGRASQSGEVYVQAYDINHYGIRLAVKQDYISFFNEEMRYRNVGKYPPYRYMCAIVFNSKTERSVSEAAFSCGQYFRKDESLRVLGPSQLLKKKDEFRYRVIIKSKNKEEMIDKVWQWYNTIQINRGSMTVTVDVDPYVLD